MQTRQPALRCNQPGDFSEFRSHLEQVDTVLKEHSHPEDRVTFGSLGVLGLLNAIFWVLT